MGDVIPFKHKSFVPPVQVEDQTDREYHNVWFAPEEDKPVLLRIVKNDIDPSP